ncbi:MAG: shikimate kinase [Nitrospinota bacterium]|nr:shikimate kinase [Nitrospinota bacterium]
MNIILLGYRGTGKSVISRLLAKQLQRPLYSLDAMIEEAVGIPIPEIVSMWGWARFREIETKIVEQAAGEARDAVIDCGGGVVLNPYNIQKLKENGKAVLLTAHIDTLLSRLSRDRNKRPQLENGLSWEEEHRKVLAEREDKYQAAADLVCDTTGKRPDETVYQIIEYFKKHSWVKA